MRNIPHSILHSWPTPNYLNPITRGPELLITNVVLLSIVSILLVLRVYTRLFLQRWFGSDDILIIIAFFLTAGFTTVILLAERFYGFDRHVWDIRLDRIQDALVVCFAIKLLFGISCSCIRVSFLCFYHRLVSRTASAWFRAAIYAVWFYVVGVFMTAILTTIFSCRPITASWTFPFQAKAKCLDDGLVGAVLGGLHCLADLLVTLLPVPIILNLQLPARIRFATLVLLQVGIVVTIAGALRTYYTWSSFESTYDTTWASYRVWFAAAVEINLGMICACVPACRPLFVKVFTPTLTTLGSRFTMNKSPRSRKPGHSLSQVVLSTGRLRVAETSICGECIEFSEGWGGLVLESPEECTECSASLGPDKTSHNSAKPWPSATVMEVDIGLAV